ncbi:hypothetical protein GCM10023339_43930 [Alloalcanivorax gelatiniphagus]
MHLKTLARRATALAAATLTMAGLMTVVTAPAHAGQVGVTISITGAGSVRVVEGTVADNGNTICDAYHIEDPTVTTTCRRIRSEAPFEAWLWLRPVPRNDDAGRWKIDPAGWQGCNTTRVVNGVTECAVHSGWNTSDERFPSIRFYDDVPPKITSVTATTSDRLDRTFSVTFAVNEAASKQCRVDNGAWEPCASPYVRTLPTDGPHKIDVLATDRSGNVGGLESRTINLVDATMEKAPPAITNSRTATFEFSTRGGATFQCALDDSDGTSYCGSGPKTIHTVTGLHDGTHTFKVWASSPTAIDPVATQHTWVVDTVAPETTMKLTHTHQDTARFEVSSPGSTSLECRLTRDGTAGAWTPCGPDSVAHTGLADGTYTQQIRGKDAAGNVDPTPATHTWTVDEVPDVPTPTDPTPTDPTPTDPIPTGPATPSPQPPVPDTTAPDTTLTAAPAEGAFVTSERTTLGWSATETASAWACTLDSAPHACSGTASELVALAPGTHRFTVAAVDAAGNRDATPATRSWTVPLASRALEHGKGWTDKRSTAAYAGSYAVSRRRGAVLSTRVRGARTVALVASTGRGHGTVKVYAGRKLLRTVRLSARTTATRTVLPVATLPAAWSGRIRVVVARPGKQVRIEGLGVTS